MLRPARAARPSSGATALLTALVLMSAACSAAPVPQPPTAVAPGDTAGPVPPADTPPADTPPADAPPADAPDLAPRPLPAPDPTAPDDCDLRAREAIGATVSAQLDAFAAEDFTTAYSVTSPFFRRAFARDDFEALIRAEYPELVGNEGHRTDECRVRSRRAFLVVGVRSGAQEIVLRYDLSQESDGWRIDGAGRLPGVSLPPDRLV